MLYSLSYRCKSKDIRHGDNGFDNSPIPITIWKLTNKRLIDFELIDWKSFKITHT